jgi:hypothetical protein
MGAARISHLECLRGYHAYLRGSLANYLLIAKIRDKGKRYDF